MRGALGRRSPNTEILRALLPAPHRKTPGYHKIGHDATAIERLFVDVLLEARWRLTPYASTRWRLKPSTGRR